MTNREALTIILFMQFANVSRMDKQLFYVDHYVLNMHISFPQCKIEFIDINFGAGRPANN